VAAARRELERALEVEQVAGGLGVARLHGRLAALS
jgi:hypothetical protein